MAEENKESVCSFCGRHYTEDDKTILFSSGEPGIFICYDCVNEIHENYKDRISDLREEKSDKLADIKWTPASMKEYLDQYIIGQDRAKEVLCTAIYNHYQILRMKESGDEAAAEVEKSNVIIAGPTGCGKTAIIKRLAKIMEVPCAIADATSLTSAGFVGDDVETCIQSLLIDCDYDIEKAQRGIVYIDEIDKISRHGENPSISTDPGHEGTQQALLKIIEGTVATIPAKGQRKSPNAEMVRVDTSNILFIVGGAFEGVEKIIERRNNKGMAGVGFGSVLANDKDKQKSFNDIIDDVRVEDLKQFGMTPEFLGRLPVICPMHELTEEQLVTILSEPKNALLKQYQTLFKVQGVDLNFDEEALKAVAHLAIERKTGARGLRGIMEDILTGEMFDIPSNDEIGSVTVAGKDFTITRNMKAPEEISA